MSIVVVGRVLEGRHRNIKSPIWDSQEILDLGLYEHEGQRDSTEEVSSGHDLESQPSVYAARALLYIVLTSKRVPGVVPSA